MESQEREPGAERPDLHPILRGLEGQFSAALAMLDYCVRNCPDSEWQEPHGDYPFSQVVFHALFYTDFYLDETLDSFKAQPFHRERASLFAGYEELEDRLPQNLYPREFCAEYLRHCLAKARAVLDGATEGKLFAASPLSRAGLSNFELYVDAIRHVQHHAAQLGLRLQLRSGREMPWASTGWKELGPPT